MQVKIRNTVIKAATSNVGMRCSSGILGAMNFTFSESAQPPAPPPPAGDGLPTRILGNYYEAYYAYQTAQPRLTDVPLSFNVIYLFHCKFNADGSAHFDNLGPNEVTAGQIQTCRSRGQYVILTLGGAGNAATYLTRSRSTALVNSLNPIISAMGGVDGIDFNNYEGLTIQNLTVIERSLMAQEMIWISQQMKATYGTAFAITTPPAPNYTVHMELVGRLHSASVLTYCAPQYYDWSGFKADGFISGHNGGTNRNLEWVNLVGANRVVIGLSANYDFTNSLTLAECTREWDFLISQHPNQRGMYAWNAKTNLSSTPAEGNNLWGSTMRARLDSL